MPGRQAAASSCPVQDILAGGSRFGGKTYWSLGDFIEHAMKWGGFAKGILFRRTYKELEEVISISKSMYPYYGFTYNETEHTWTNDVTGATLKLRYLKRDADAMNYQGHSYTWICFDEAGNWAKPTAIDQIKATLRSVHIPSSALRFILTANPGGPGQSWLMERYILHEKGEYREPMVPFWYRPLPELAPDTWVEAIFIPFGLDDNILADKAAYEKTLVTASHGNPALYRAWRYGDWSAFVGQAFHELDQSVHVIDSYVPQNAVRWAAGLDWGYQQGWIGLAARTAEKRWEIVHEVYFSKIDAKRAAYNIAKRWEKLGIRPEAIYADNRMWQTTGSEVNNPRTLADEWNKGMLAFYGDMARVPPLVASAQGPGSRAVKYQLMHAALKFERGPDGRVDPWNLPEILIHRRCRNLIRTLWALPDDPDKPGEDVDTDADDHAYDGLCNILLSEHAAPEHRPARPPHAQHPGMTPKGERKPKWHDQYDEEDDRLWEQEQAGYDPGFRMPHPSEYVK